MPATKQKSLRDWQFTMPSPFARGKRAIENIPVDRYMLISMLELGTGLVFSYDPMCGCVSAELPAGLYGTTSIHINDVDCDEGRCGGMYWGVEITREFPRSFVSNPNRVQDERVYETWNTLKSDRELSIPAVFNRTIKFLRAHGYLD